MNSIMITLKINMVTTQAGVAIEEFVGLNGFNDVVIFGK